MKTFRAKISFKYFVFQWLWLIILFPKPVQLFIFFTVAVVLLRLKRFYVFNNCVSIAMFFLFLLHSIAIIFNIVVLHTDPQRIPAAINTALLWPITALYVAYYKSTDVDIMRIGKYCTQNIFILLFPAIIATFMFYVLHVSAYTLLGNPLFVTTWLQENPTIKFMGFNDFSNMNLFYIMINFVLAVPYIDSKKRKYLVLVICIAAFEVFLIHSRAGMVLFTISVLFCYIDLFPPKYRKLIFAFGGMMSILFLILSYKKVMDILLNTIVYGNVDSTEYRVSLLKSSIEEVWKSSPIFGMGIKRVFRPGESFVAYLGSHSTYVGFFYKTGIPGLITGLFIFLKSNWQIFKHIRTNHYVKANSVFLLSFMVLLAIEDIDGTNWSIVMYFSSLMILARHSELRRNLNYLWNRKS